MGQAYSRSTPLQCLLSNFKDFSQRAQGYGSCITPFDLQRFCQLDWPTFGAGWPSGGSLNLQVAFRVHNVVYNIPGHPDQAPYIDVWIDIVSDATKYLKACQCKSDRKHSPQPILMAGSKDLKEKPPNHLPWSLYPILQALSEYPKILNPPPCYSPGNPFWPPVHGEAEPLQSPPHTRTRTVYQLPQDPAPAPDSTQPAAVLAPL